MKHAYAAAAAILFLGWGTSAMSDDQPKAGEQVAQTATLSVQSPNDDAPRDVTVHYWLYLPKESAGAETPAPLVLFLHGAGERGDDLDLVKIHGPPRLASEGKDFPFILVSPQQPKSDPNWRNDQWAPEILMALVDHVVKTQKADASRLYVTGLSMGGYGTWKLIAAHPDRFAAAAPVCGGGDAATAERITHIPIWAFHGDEDGAVPLARGQEMVDAVNAAGGKAELTVYPGVGHNSWDATYDNPKLYEWLLSHQLEKP